MARESVCMVVVFDVSLFVFSSFLCMLVFEISIYIKFTNSYIQAIYMLLPVSLMWLHVREVCEGEIECVVVYGHT